MLSRNRKAPCLMTFIVLYGLMMCLETIAVWRLAEGWVTSGAIRQGNHHSPTTLKRRWEPPPPPPSPSCVCLMVRFLSLQFYNSVLPFDRLAQSCCHFVVTR